MHQLEYTNNEVPHTPLHLSNIDVQSWGGPWVPLTNILHQPHAIIPPMSNGGGVGSW